MASITNELSHKDWTKLLEREERAFHDQLPSLLRSHEGEYVAIYERQVVGHSPDESVLVSEMFSKLGYVPFFVERVTREPIVVETTSFEQSR